MGQKGHIWLSVRSGLSHQATLCLSFMVLFFLFPGFLPALVAG